jgi:succinyl-diaminopimelate desuccinylase
MNDLDHAIDTMESELLQLCADLVAAESINPPGRTADMARVVSGWLRSQGVNAEIVGCDDHAPNVISRVVGSAPGRHVVFNAHMDTMPVGDEALWTVPPLELTRRQGRAYGLGMGNMKGALAGMCIVTTLLQSRAAELAGRLTLTAVSDEVMFGSRGTVLLLDQFPDLLGDFLISGEGPGYGGLAVAEKGLLWLDVEARGPSGHSSNARSGETAPAILARFLTDVDRLNDRFAPPLDELPEVSGGEDDLGFRLSVNVGALLAGGVRSQMADVARAELDFRLPPGIDADEVEAIVRGFVPAGAQIAITRAKGWDANWTELTNPIVRTVSHAAEAVYGIRPAYVVRLPGSDAREWRSRGVPAICYGPQPTLSAGIDDYAEERDLVGCAKVYARAALNLMATPS